MRGTQPQPQPLHLRNTLRFGVLLFAAVCVGIALLLRSQRPAHQLSPAPVVAAAEPRPASPSSLPVVHQEPAPPAPAAPAPAKPAVVPPEALAPRQLMDQLIELSSVHGPLTAEQAERFKQDLAELVRKGPDSVPALREFLARNTDANFAALEGGDQLGYSSLRASLFDTLKQIGGPEAQAALLQALQTTALPSEMLELAKDLDQQTPGVYRDQILSAAHDALALDAAGQLGTNREVGPAFHILQTYGAPNTIAEVAKTDPVNFYNALNLASLPDGQGLPSLVQMVQNGTGAAQTVATEMIAQLAGQNSQALDALLQMAQKGQISNGAWMRLAPILAGDQYQLDSSVAPAGTGAADASGTLNYSVVNQVSTPDQINQRIALLDQCLGLVAADSAAAHSLRQERDLLLAKLNH